MASEFDSFLNKLEVQGLLLARDVETKRLLVLSEGELQAAEEARRREVARAKAEKELIAPIPPSARIPVDDDDEEEELVAVVDAAQAGREEQMVAAVAPPPLSSSSAAAAASAAAGSANPAARAASGGGRFLLQSGTAGGSLGGSAPLTSPVSSGGGSQQPRPSQRAAFAAAGGAPSSNGTTPAQGGNRPTDPAQFLYSGPAVGATPNSIARVLPQFPANFSGTRPVIQTNPLSLLANGVYQGTIFSGGTSRSVALATVPTPTPPAPVIYQPGAPINNVVASSGISVLTNANSALSVVSNWPFNDFRNNFPNQNVDSASSLRTLFCATPLTQWCTNTLPIAPSLVNSVFQGTQNPNFLIG